jgi:hypothetical protein
MAKTPDIIDDNRHNLKKHVTFATTHLVRSATVGGINNIHSTTPLSERLVNDKIQVQYILCKIFILFLFINY